MLGQINSSANQGGQITAAEFAAKYKSKKEVYALLAVDVGAYLPAYQLVTIYFLKDLLSGKKLCKLPNSFNLVFYRCAL